MEKKSVLVTYRQHNEVLCIETLDGEGDIQILEDEFRKEFKLESATDLSITFQCFDTEFINLDSSSTLYHKDKHLLLLWRYVLLYIGTSYACV